MVLMSINLSGMIIKLPSSHVMLLETEVSQMSHPSGIQGDILDGPEWSPTELLPHK